MTVGTVLMRYHSSTGPDKEGAEHEPYTGGSDDTAI